MTPNPEFKVIYSTLNASEMVKVRDVLYLQRKTNMPLHTLKVEM